MFWGGLNGDGFADESDYDYGSYAEGPYYRNRSPSKPKPVTCSRCGCKDLYWTRTENGWRLMYGSGSKLSGKLHACDFEGEYVAKHKDDFNAVADVIDMDGLDYCFIEYSSWEEIKDVEFQLLRQAYVDAAIALREYVEERTDYDE